jgi:hypothetical protein
MAGLLWLVSADWGLPLDSLGWLGAGKIRTWVVDRPHGHVLRCAGYTADSRSFGTPRPALCKPATCPTQAGRSPPESVGY